MDHFQLGWNTQISTEHPQAFLHRIFSFHFARNLYFKTSFSVKWKGAGVLQLQTIQSRVFSLAVNDSSNKETVRRLLQTNNNGYTYILPAGVARFLKLLPNFRTKYVIFPNLSQTRPSSRLHTIQVFQMIKDVY